MKRRLLIFAVLTLLSFAVTSSIVYGQVDKGRITAEEKKAAQDLADRFISRLDEKGDIEPLTKEMFVSDFMRRYVAEKMSDIAANKGVSTNILFATGLEYKSELLAKATEDDWRKFYVETFNFLQYGFSVTLNRSAKSMLAGGNFDEKVLDNIYPRAIVSLFEPHPILHNLIRKKDKAVAIGTVDELSDVNKKLAEAWQVLRAGNGPVQMKMTPDAKQMLKLSREKLENQMGASLIDSDGAHYGFPKGTRLIAIWATITHHLLIVKDGSGYKIVSAEFSSID